MNSSANPKKYLTKELLFICRMLSFEEGYKGNEFVTDLKALSTEVLLTTLRQHHIFPVFYTRWVSIQNHKALQTPEWVKFTEDLKALVHANRLQMLHKLKVLVEVSSTLEKEGIPVISLKGPVLSKVLYGDFAMKASLDLDILIDKSQVDEAMEVLKSEGFVLATYNLTLTPSQKKYLKNHFHHLGFYHPVEKVHLELHWQLNTNKYLLEYSFEEILESSIYVEVGENKIRTLDACKQTIYLMVHGAYHAWIRIDWLFEFSMARIKLQNDFLLTREAAKQELIYPLCISNDLSGVLFLTKQLKSFCPGKAGIKELGYILRSMQRHKTADYSEPVFRVLDKLYIMKFKASIRYKLHVWKSMFTNLKDWNDVRLPNKFFFLYYLIRPYLVIRNSIYRRKNI